VFVVTLACSMMRLLACLASASVASSSSIVDGKDDISSILEISLTPPSVQLPEISAEVGDLETAREGLESSMMTQIRRAAQQAFAKVEGDIASISSSLARSCQDGQLRTAFGRRAIAFLSKRSGPSQDAVTLEVKAGMPPDSTSIKSKIRDVEQQRKDAEIKFFQQAVSEMNELGAAFTAELRAQMERQFRGLLTTPHVGFLQLLRSKQVVIGSETPYPTLASMLRDMESRRDIAENLAQRQVALEKLMFLQAANTAAKQRLKAAVTHCMSQRESQ